MAQTITVNITDEQEACLKNDLLDINDWVQKAVEGKVNNCAKRLDNEWRQKIDADPAITSVPADVAGRSAIIFAHKDYQNRKLREAVEAAKSAADALVKAQARATETAKTLADAKAADPVDQKAIDAAQVADDEAQSKLVAATAADTAAKAAVTALK